MGQTNYETVNQWIILTCIFPVPSDSLILVADRSILTTKFIFVRVTKSKQQNPKTE